MMLQERILVVNDELDVARLLAIELGEAGYQNVFTCSSAEEALKTLEHHKPALVISDIHMGGLDGFQLCRILKSTDYQECNDIPVILVSASFRDSRAVSLARDAGAFAFVENPKDMDRLAALVNEALDGRRHAESQEFARASASRALVVSSDAVVRDSVAECLGSDGFRVVSLSDALIPERAVHHDNFDIVLVADDSRWSDDARLTEWMRRFAVDAPLIVLRTGGAQGHWAELLEAGADDYVDRPLSDRDVKAACQRALLRRELRSTSDRIESSEHRLRVSEDRYRRQSGLLKSLMDSSGDGIVLCDARLRIASLNSAATKIFSGRSQSLLGRSVKELVGHDAVVRFEEFLSKPATKGESFEIDRTVDGQSIALSIGVSQRDDSEGGAGLLLIVRDITKERDLWTKLAQSQKIDSLGALAGGMAHDFNNILATILPNAELIGSLCSENAKVCERASAIQIAARRGGELTKRLLGFARPRSERDSMTDPNASVETTVAMLRETLDRKIRVDLDLMREHVVVPLDASQLEHTLLNLAINARDAMPNGGTLRFKTWIKPMTGADDNADEMVVGILVEDTGEGMSAETKDKIFEPFFTTKSEDGGTGLGLSTACEIVRSAKGLIEVDTEVGQGTRFHIYLPATARKPVRVRRRPSPVPGRRERVLVIDDEGPVRELIAEMLTRLNYEVFSAASGAEGLEVFREKEVDLVVLDMIMPDMDGCETYEALKAIRPDVCAMLSSGDPQNPRTAALEDDGVLALQKPFSLTALSATVRSALDQHHSPAPMGQTA